MEADDAPMPHPREDLGRAPEAFSQDGILGHVGL
jgi:hypothetical protein